MSDMQTPARETCVAALQEKLAALRAEGTFDSFMNPQLADFDYDNQELTLRFEVKPWMLNVLGIVHGGLYASMADCVMGSISCFWTNSPHQLLLDQFPHHTVRLAADQFSASGKRGRCSVVPRQDRLSWPDYDSRQYDRLERRRAGKAAADRLRRLLQSSFEAVITSADTADTSKAVRFSLPFSSIFTYSRLCSRPVTDRRVPTGNPAVICAVFPQKMQGR